MLQFQHNDMSVGLLGDPHLGRSFVHGVPLDRRGERERLVWEQFERELWTDVDVHVCMGDLFDKPFVGYSTMLRTALLYRVVAETNPNRSFVIIKGNHDWLRDLEAPSAFDVFAKLVADLPNLTVVDTWMEMNGLMFLGWHPTITSVSMLETAIDNAGIPDIVFGHWDTEFGESNMIPTKAMSTVGIKRAYTGHIHLPDRFSRDGVKVQVVGSMQPYAHGEEPDDSLYITLRKSELGDHDLRNKCVRVLLAPDELLEDPVDCLQLTVKKESNEFDDEPTVTIGDFDMEALFRQAFRDANVPAPITEQLFEKFAADRVGHGT